MAIVSTFDKCLDSPYLFQDATAPGRVASLVSQSAARLEAAGRLQSAGGDSGDVCLLSYESMFAALRALVYSRGYRESGLKCLLLAARELFVKDGSMAVDHLHHFERVQALRESPGESLKRAGEFLDVVRGLVSANAIGSGSP